MTFGGSFVAKFNSAGNALVYSTYLGGSTPGNGTGDSANAIVVDGAGSAYVVGATSATDFPTVAAVQTVNRAIGVNNGGVGNAFVTKFNANGSALLYSTYLGGTNDEANAIAIDSAGNAYVAGATFSNNFPIADALQSTNNGANHGSSNAFISVLDPAGLTLKFST